MAGYIGRYLRAVEIEVIVHVPYICHSSDRKCVEKGKRAREHTHKRLSEAYRHTCIAHVWAHVCANTDRETLPYSPIFVQVACMGNRQNGGQ